MNKNVIDSVLFEFHVGLSLVDEPLPSPMVGRQKVSDPLKLEFGRQKGEKVAGQSFARKTGLNCGQNCIFSQHSYP